MSQHNFYNLAIVRWPLAVHAPGIKLYACYNVTDIQSQSGICHGSVELILFLFFLMVGGKVCKRSSCSHNLGGN